MWIEIDNQLINPSLIKTVELDTRTIKLNFNDGTFKNVTHDNSVRAHLRYEEIKRMLLGDRKRIKLKELKELIEHTQGKEISDTNNLEKAHNTVLQLIEAQGEE